jgi:hypothetical protein
MLLRTSGGRCGSDLQCLHGRWQGVTLCFCALQWLLDLKQEVEKAQHQHSNELSSLQQQLQAQQQEAQQQEAQQQEAQEASSKAQVGKESASGDRAIAWTILALRCRCACFICATGSR